MRPNRSLETFERNFAKVFKRQCFSFAQLGNDVRNEDLLGLRMRTKARGQLHGASEQIVVMLDRFAGSDAKPNIKWTIFVFTAMPGNFALDAAGAFNRSGGGDEGRHNAVTEVLDFASPQIRQGAAHNRVMHAQQFHRCVITDASSERS